MVDALLPARSAEFSVRFPRLSLSSKPAAAPKHQTLPIQKELKSGRFLDTRCKEAGYGVSSLCPDIAVVGANFCQSRSRQAVSVKEALVDSIVGK